jgi:F-type H+-transporting ATPase subunit gamma
LETKASEHSARMIAMKNATDNAKELVQDLTLTYNGVRQDAITSELAEITTAGMALE